MVKKILEELNAKEVECTLKAKAVNPTQFQKWISKALAFTQAKKIVQKIANEYNDDWISVKNKLPTQSGEYYTYVYYDNHYMYAIDEFDCEGILKQWNCSSDYKIIAWKPINPYQGEM